MSMLRLEEKIHKTKQCFEKHFCELLHLTKVSAPIFVSAKSGIQDNLSGTENPIHFSAKQISDERIEIVHSLAKWKRLALKRYQVPVGEGILTDMRAIRPDEADLSTGIHSIYVDQWDWEKTIAETDRHIDFLKQTVREIYHAIQLTEMEIAKIYQLETFLPTKIHFFHAEDLVKFYPKLTPKEREYQICREKKAVFVMGIGHPLSDGKKHDERAPDYDDWSTLMEENKPGLNGDIMVWNPILQNAFEISSMGIRIDSKTLLHQLKLCDCEHRQQFPWHQLLLNGELPFSIGGGIGQSRLVMLLLQKRHIGEIQVSHWPQAVIDYCRLNAIELL